MEVRARAAGLRFASSRSFIADQGDPRGLRVGFASLDERESGRAIAALYAAAYPVDGVVDA